MKMVVLNWFLISRKCSATDVSKMSRMIVKMKSVARKRSPSSRKCSVLRVSKMYGAVAENL